MRTFKQAAAHISKWVDPRHYFVFHNKQLTRRRYFLHLPGLYLKRLFNQKSKPTQPLSSNKTEKKDLRTVKLWERQDYPLWELQTIAKEGSIRGHKITTFKHVGKIEKQSHRIGGYHNVPSAHKYMVLPEKEKEEKDPIPERWNPERSTDCRTRISRL